jgi:dephospho-CoA kinase
LREGTAGAGLVVGRGDEDGAVIGVQTVRVGLTGGIGSGKSAVAEMWRERGAVIIDGDVLARDVVAPGSEALREIAKRWPAVIAADGSLDRAALARIVFADDDERLRLNAIVHPRVRRLAEQREADAPDGSIAVHVIPLLFEGDSWRTCDATVLVAAPDDVRIARVVARDDTAPDGVLARMRAQIDPAEARTLATYVIENDAGLDTLRTRANAVYDELLKLR